MFIYFGLCFLAIASAIYQIFCPPEIKGYATAVDYIAATRPNMGDVALGRLESRLLKRRSAAVEFKLFQGHLFEKLDKYHDNHAAERDQEKAMDAHWRDVLELNYRSLNVECPSQDSVSLSSRLSAAEETA